MSQRSQRMSAVVMARAPRARSASGGSKRFATAYTVRRGAARDLEVDRRLARFEARRTEQPFGDARKNVGLHDVRRRNTELAESELQPRKMRVELERPAGDDAPDLVHAVAEHETAVVDRQGRR